MADDRVTINDVRACGFCVRETKAWLEIHGFDPRQMIGLDASGIPAADILATGDEFGRQVVERMRRG